MKDATGLAVALVAAFVATVGDFSMLLVANAAQPELGLSSPPAFVLPAGALLGVFAIPLYALGYRSVARSLGDVSARRSRIVLVSGAATAALGSLIHAWTAITIAEGAASDPASTFVEMLSAGGVVSAAWATAAAFATAASLAIASPRALRAAGRPRHLALLTPAMVAVALGATGLPFEFGRAFWLPAAPNVAHIVFFGAWLVASGRRARPLGTSDALDGA